MDPAKSRGRARGRARGNVDQGQQARPGPPQQGPPPQGAWGPRPGQSGPRQGGPGPRPQPQQAAPAWGPQAQQRAPPQQAPRPQAPAPSGRAVVREPVTGPVHEGIQRLTLGPGGDAGNSEGSGNGAAAGRGSVRGRRQLPSSETLLTRPRDLASKKGLAGTPVKLSANYFQLLTHTDWNLFQYRVDFAPEEDRTNIKKKLFREATNDVLSGYLFDGSMMFTSRRLQPDPMELFVNPPEGSTSNQPIRITIRLVGDVSKGDFQLIQFFNILMRRCLTHMNLQLVGRNYYDAVAKIPIPQYDIELWPGYITSIRQHEHSILLNSEISHKHMRKENVLDVLKQTYQRHDRDFKEVFTKQIIGSVVLTDYNNKTYRVDDVQWNSTPQSTFNKSDGSSISYIQYYRDRYQLKISDMNQPLLVSRAKRREIRAGMAEIIYLIPELCRMTGLTDNERNNMQMMRELANHTRIAPEGRIQRLEQFSRRMRTNQKIVEELKKWDMELASKLVDIPGRILPSENIIQGTQGTIRYPSGAEVDWTRNLRSNEMLSLGECRSWCVVCPTFMKREAGEFVAALRKAAQGMHFNLPNPDIQEVRDDRPASYMDAIEQAIQRKNPQMLLCAAPNNKPDRYAAIKKKTYVDHAIPTQVVLKKSMVAKGVMSIATKVAIQMNCKLGGAPWTVEMPLSSLMVIGYDACHDTMNKGRSFGAMVASLDRFCSKFYSTVSAHTNGEELSNDFSLNVIKALKKYQEVNDGKLPQHIMIYRDGVGDGQLHYVVKHELEFIKKALNEYYPDKLKLAFIVVTKRINTRIFAGGRNPVPGTVVDDIITLPERYDFFIVSQCVRQGTVSPTSYNVIHDTLGLNPDKIQRLTYKFTHLYYNWSGTVRVPAPCQYAHKLAFLVSQSIHRNPNTRLDTSLYFL